MSGGSHVDTLILPEDFLHDFSGIAGKLEFCKQFEMYKNWTVKQRAKNSSTLIRWKLPEEIRASKLTNVQDFRYIVNTFIVDKVKTSKDLESGQGRTGFQALLSAWNIS